MAEEQPPQPPLPPKPKKPSSRTQRTTMGKMVEDALKPRPKQVRLSRALRTLPEQQRYIAAFLKGLGYEELIIGQILQDHRQQRPIGHAQLLERYGDELRMGRPFALARVAASIYEMACWGDEAERFKAAQLIARTQMGWRETTRIEHTGADGKPIKVESGADLSWCTDDELREIENIYQRAAERAAAAGASADLDGGAEGVGDTPPERLH